MNEKKNGHISFIDEWFKELNNIVEYTKSAHYTHNNANDLKYLNSDESN
jgi:hypothetical protein